MSCRCDTLLFPPPAAAIAAGLPRVPRQIATFPEYRAAMLRSIASKGPLGDWRARSREDFGIMLLEFWAYLCDNLSFIDDFLVNEAMLRTAIDRASLRKLTDLLGYIPRPAIAAQVDVALLLDGRRAVLIPAGTGFRSGAFPGSPPQVFETAVDVTLDPRNNQWSVVRQRAASIGGTGSVTSLLIDPRTLRVKEGDVIRVSGPGISFGRKVTRVSDSIEADGDVYKKIQWTPAASIPASTAPSAIKVTRATRTARLWEKPEASNWPWTPIGAVSGLTWAYLDDVYGELRAGSEVAMVREGEVRALSVSSTGKDAVTQSAGVTTEVKNASNVVQSTVTSPAVKKDLTWIYTTPDFNSAAARGASGAVWTSADAGTVAVHFNFQPAGDVVAPYLPQIGPGAPLLLAPPVEMSIVAEPAQFQLTDVDETATAFTGGIDYAARRIVPDAGAGLTSPMVPPITAYGNIVRATRGESVPWEVLGTGNGALARQSFTLKKKPLTYTPGPEAPVSTLRVYVDGVQWSEVRSFYGRNPEEEVYIVRQDDEDATTITMNPRLRTGAVVAASYRFGAGLASPPAGSIRQIAKPVERLRGVRNPIAAFGGDDREPASGLRVYAPRSALLLGRAISLPDMEAAAINTGGVRAARAGWRWNSKAQTAVVQIWYIGAAPVEGLLLSRLRGITDGVTPISVDPAQAVPVQLSISVALDGSRIEADVVAAVGQALLKTGEGLLVPERIGIGIPLFRSRVFEAVLAVPGTAAVTGLLWNGLPWIAFGKDPGAGKYFDFESGAVYVNGEAQ